MLKDLKRVPRSIVSRGLRSLKTKGEEEYMNPVWMRQAKK